MPVPKHLDDILTTIRLVESSNNYTIPPNRGGASGAYQYIDSTWNNYNGYPKAYLAPSAVQDQRALADVQSILKTWNNDVSMIPVIWYFPRAARDPSLMDKVPLPGSGNRLTVREYQFRWLGVLEYLIGAPLLYRLSLLPPEFRFLSGIPPEVIYNQLDVLQVAFPVLGKATLAPPAACLAEECSGSPAIIYGQRLQPILASVDGVVTAVERGDDVSGAVTVVITDPAGRTFHYAGFNDDSPNTSDGAAIDPLRLTVLAKIGTSVKAGQVIGFMGDTDPMPSLEHRGLEPGATVWPHLRLTIRNRDGTMLDADGLVAAAQFRQACQVGIGPWAVPPDPTLKSADLDDVDVSAIVYGNWTIHGDGTVTATGKSALFVSAADCTWAPTRAFGPGAAGANPPLIWFVPVKIPPAFWVSGAVAGVGATPITPLRSG